MIRCSAFGLQGPRRCHRIGRGSLDLDGGRGCRTYQGNQTPRGRSTLSSTSRERSAAVPCHAMQSHHHTVL
ncbi:hypothetical protein PAXINDRAFT_170069, partial [Paxillus involutus ATCC 200175]